MGMSPVLGVVSLILCVSLLEAVEGDARIAVIGALLQDTIAKASQGIIQGSSVHGHVSTSFGGVGWNVARSAYEYMRRSGHPRETCQEKGNELDDEVMMLGDVVFCSAIGNDISGEGFLRTMEEIGMSSGCIQRIPGGRTASFVGVHDRDGELVNAIADTEIILKHLTVPWLRSIVPLLSQHSSIILDANIPLEVMEELLNLLASNALAPLHVWYEPTSVAKAGKVMKFPDRLGSITHVKPALLELFVMAELIQPHLRCSCTAESSSIVQSLLDDDVAQRVDAAKVGCAAAQLIHTGLRNLIVTMGRDGVLVFQLVEHQGRPQRIGELAENSAGQCAAEINVEYMRAVEVEHVVNVNGAGDALLGCAVAALSLETGDLIEAVLKGMGCAAQRLSPG